MVKIILLGHKVLFTSSIEPEEEIKILRASLPAGLLSSNSLCTNKFSRQLLKPNQETPLSFSLKFTKQKEKTASILLQTQHVLHEFSSYQMFTRNLLIEATTILHKGILWYVDWGCHPANAINARATLSFEPWQIKQHISI